MSILTLIVYIFKLRHYKICYYIFILKKKTMLLFWFPLRKLTGELSFKN